MGQQRKTLTPERSPAHRWGWELRSRRDRAGLSLAGLGRLVTFDPSYLARLERGEQFPSEGAATACDAALGAGGELIRLRAEADVERRRTSLVGASATVPGPASAEHLPSFAERAVCPKCASVAVGVAYHVAPTGGYPCASSVGEHLCRVCQRCGYGWCEATADATPVRRSTLRLVRDEHQPPVPRAN
jgi:transcriptional regulator with XRE-family HTH domain